MRAGALDGSLRPRVLGLAESLPGPSWLALFVDTGRAWFAGQDAPIEGPALAWRPWPRDSRAKFAAGATGSYVVVGSATLANVIGYMPETQDLRQIADRVLNAPLSGRPETLQVMRSAFLGLHREIESERIATRAVIEAYLRLILVEVYRIGQIQIAGSDRTTPSHRIFTRFSELVETHFRDRWSVNDYARRLNISRDRLGDICVRVRGMGPKALIDRRLAVEARLQLETSSNSIQQIAALLGFSSASQFTRFFRRAMEIPPGTYRRDHASDRQPGQDKPALPYEWP